MTPEEKAAAQAAEAEAKAAEDKAAKEAEDAEFEAGLDGLSDEEKEAKRAEKNKAGTVDKNKDIDYEAELKAERERATKAEKALADKRFKDAEKRRKEAEANGTTPDDDEDDDKPVTRRELAKVKEEARREAQEERALELAASISGSDAEAQLIVAKWKNRTFPEGLSLSEQIEEMHAVVHRKKLIGERNEAMRGLKSKETANRNTAATHREGQPGTVPKLPAADEKAIKAAGYVWNAVTRRHEKKLKNGQIVVRDSNGKVFLAPKAK